LWSGAFVGRWILAIATERGVSEFETPFFCAAAFPLFRFIAQAGTVDAPFVNAHNPACPFKEISQTRGVRARVVAEWKRA
jgi:hypothetical protein